MNKNNNTINLSQKNENGTDLNEIITIYKDKEDVAQEINSPILRHIIENVIKFFSQVTLTIEANSLIALSRLVMSDMLKVLIFLMELVRSLMIECLLEMMCSSAIGMMMVRGAWSDESLQSG